VDFENPLQSCQEWVEGSRWPRFRIAQTENGSNVATILYPDLRQGDEIQLVFADGECPEDVMVVATDGLHKKDFSIALLQRNDSVTAPLPYAFYPNRFGFEIKVIYPAQSVLKKAFLVNPGNCEHPFMQVRPGFQLACLSGESLRAFGYYSETEGFLPLFDQPHTQNTQTPKAVNDQIPQMVIQGNVYQPLYEMSNDLLTEKEQARAYLNTLLEETETKYFTVCNRLEETETKYHIVRNRTAQRILVLSHMFPTTSDPIGGCFVHEQVKSLIQDQDMDARVISCKPHWMNGYKPMSLYRSNQEYHRQINAADWEQYDGVPTLYLPYRVGNPLLPFRMHATMYTRAIMAAIADVSSVFRFDAIHAHTSYLDGSAARAVSQRYGIPYMITEHTGPFSILTNHPAVRKQTLQAIHDAAAVWGVSDYQADVIKEYFIEEPGVQQKISTLYNGVNLDRFLLRNCEAGPRDAFRIVYVGYLEEVKDPLTLIHGFKIVSQKNPRATLTIIGQGTMWEKVKDSIAQMDLESKVTMLGEKTRDEVADIFANHCDLLVLPSRQESFGVVVIEAMACGIPVVATRCGGPESTIKTELVGELCEKENPEEFAKAMIAVMDNYEKYDPAQISNYARDNFSSRAISAELAQFYQQY